MPNTLPWWPSLREATRSCERAGMRCGARASVLSQSQAPPVAASRDWIQSRALCWDARPQQDHHGSEGCDTQWVHYHGLDSDLGYYLDLNNGRQTVLPQGHFTQAGKPVIMSEFSTVSCGGYLPYRLGHSRRSTLVDRLRRGGQILRRVPPHSRTKRQLQPLRLPRRCGRGGSSRGGSSRGGVSVRPDPIPRYKKG